MRLPCHRTASTGPLHRAARASIGNRSARRTVQSGAWKAGHHRAIDSRQRPHDGRRVWSVDGSDRRPFVHRSADSAPPLGGGSFAPLRPRAGDAGRLSRSGIPFSPGLTNGRSSSLFTVLSAAIIGLIIWQIRMRLAGHRRISDLRRRISSDLHDEVGSNLATIALLSEIAPVDDGAERFGDISRMARESSQSLREIVDLTIAPEPRPQAPAGAHPRDRRAHAQGSRLGIHRRCDPQSRSRATPEFRVFPQGGAPQCFPPCRMPDMWPSHSKPQVRTRCCGHGQWPRPAPGAAGWTTPVARAGTTRGIPPWLPHHRIHPRGWHLADPALSRSAPPNDHDFHRTETGLSDRRPPGLPPGAPNGHPSSGHLACDLAFSSIEACLGWRRPLDAGRCDPAGSRAARHARCCRHSHLAEAFSRGPDPRNHRLRPQTGGARSAGRRGQRLPAQGRPSRYHPARHRRGVVRRSAAQQPHRPHDPHHLQRGDVRQPATSI